MDDFFQVLDGLRQKEKHSNPDSYVVLVAVSDPGSIVAIPLPGKTCACHEYVQAQRT